MLFKIIGWFWIISGFYFLIRPTSLMRRLQRKSKWKTRSFFFFIAFIWGAPLIALGWQEEGLIPKLLVAVGIIVLLKGIFFISTKTSEKFIEWSSQKAPYVFRLFSIIQIIMGFTIKHLADKK
ncbi:MAG: hypothetical protein KAI43_02245 [Candidatus Aureabacteria bacterium]|nr:hypothetical protein [Candidatus Auribacterota bacterium]